MKPEKICVCTLSLLFIGFSALHAADEIKWNGKSGKWSDGSIWEGGTAPGETQLASFPNGRKLTGTVEIDGDYRVNSLYLKQQDNSGEYPVEFTGSGSISVAAQLLINQNRKLILNGPSIEAGTVSVGNRLEINGRSSLSCGTLKSSQEGMTLSVNDGVIAADKLTISDESCHVAATNADIRIGTVSGTPAYSLCGGVFAVTNGGLTIASGVDEAHFDVDEFALAGTLDAADTDVKVVFDRAVTIGAYGNWSTGANIAEVNFAASPVFNTTDAADNETGRTVTIKNISLQSKYDSIVVSGCGTLAISQKDNPFRLESLLLNEGAGLSVKNNSYGVISLVNLEMKSDSSISLTAGKASFEIESTKIAPTASVTVGSPSETDSRYQIWTDFSNGTKPAFICTGDGTYSVRTAGPFAFASGADAGATKDKPTEWTGSGVGSNWTTVGNWNETVPEGTGSVAYFSGDTNTVVMNDSARTVARMHISENGAFAFFGEPIGLNSTTTNANNAPIYISGSLPVAVYNALSKTSNKATGLSFVTYGDTFMALMGEVALTNLIFRFSGDMRIGGNVNCANVIFDPKIGSRHPSCTVLPGAELVATAQREIQSNGIGYDVRKGGVLDVRSGIWDWSVPVTNNVEGTLKLGAAFGTSSKSYFSGRGDIVLAGENLQENGAEAVVVGSNTVIAAVDTVLGKWSVDDGATLTLDSNGNVFTFTEPIGGEGRLVFAPGTKAALGGGLRAAALSSDGVVISSAAETVGSLVWPGNHHVYLDGGVYRVKRRPGFSINVR
ncbi:MAG: hypothetical protein E7046_04720 [Lentisphaerae bacterium]|nr:hypothetical protein [Lentisphaerota bacterium]